jgi:site-specific DNA recombinase
MIAIYIRTSKDVVEPTSPENQEEICLNYVKSKGFKDWKIYRDIDEPGYSADIRPAWNELMKDIHEEKISDIVVWKWDRLARRSVDALIMYHQLDDAGIAMHSVTEPLDLSTDLGSTMFGQIAVQSEAYAKTIALNTTKGKKKRLSEGRMAGGNLPTGYRYLNPGNAKKERKEAGAYIDEEKAPIVPRAFHLRSEGYSYLQIEHKMKAEDFKVDWSTIRKIVSRECYYTGKFINKHTEKKRRLDGSKKVIGVKEGAINVPKLIAKELWDKVQKVNASHITYYGRSKRDWLFKGRIKCVACSKHPYINDRNSGYCYYQHECSHGKSISIDAPKTDQLIWHSFVKKLGDEQGLKRTIEALKIKNPKEKISDLKRQNKVIDDKSKKLRREINQYVDFVLDTDSRVARRQYEAKMEKLDQEIKDLGRTKEKNGEKIDEMERRRLEIENAPKIISEIQKRYGNLENLPPKKKKEIVDRIYLPSSIEFFPNWWIRENKKELDFELYGPMLKESGHKVKQGFLMCTGLLDYDYQEIRKRPDFKKLRESIEFHSENDDPEN